ncbi:MAG: hypothetical protein MMC33_009367 [Icmadophila ericetorum]|nr:hypothetical protein [Icmadophila ericetorum]
MDMQGIPIGSTNRGMKVRKESFNPLPLLQRSEKTNKHVHFPEKQNTTDPRSQIPIQEGAGAVASDSLAAESTRSGGGFGENRDSTPLAVEGSKSTLNNTDISAATTLPPAADSADRESRFGAEGLSNDVSGPGGAKYAEATGGQGKFSGVHNQDGYYGGPSDGGVAASSAGGTSGTSAAGGGSVSGSGSSSVDPAPTYVTSQYVDPGKPKGKNLTEGGFDSDDKNNASFNADIGSENNPGRAAELNFQKQAASNVGSGPRQSEIIGDGQYDVLETDQNL